MRNSAAFAQRRPHPGHKLPGAEGLAHIIVGADSEAVDDAFLVNLRGDHDDGDLRDLPDLFAESFARKIREHEVQQNQRDRIGRGGAFLKQPYPFLAVFRAEGGITVHFQVGFYQFEDFGLVVHHQNGLVFLHYSQHTI